MKHLLLCLIFLLPTASQVLAEPPVIQSAKITNQGEDIFNVSVTLSHPDTGWDHYANAWIVTANGITLGTRTLLHPHVNEQPFTRHLTMAIDTYDIQSLHVIAVCNHDEQSEPHQLRFMAQ